MPSKRPRPLNVTVLQCWISSQSESSTVKKKMIGQGLSKTSRLWKCWEPKKNRVLHWTKRESDSTDNTLRKDCDRTYSYGRHSHSGGCRWNPLFTPVSLRCYSGLRHIGEYERSARRFVRSESLPCLRLLFSLGIKEIIVTRAGHTGYQPETLPHI